VQSIDCFQTASSPLVDVGIYNEFRHVPILLPGHQLTRYRLDSLWEQHTRILKQAANLIEACITNDFDDNRPYSGETIDLLHLRRLYVSDASILECLSFHALEELALDGSQHPTLPSLIHSFLDRSSCFPRRLYLPCPIAHTTAEIFRNCPSICELVIINDASAAAEINLLMAALTVSNTPGSTTVAAHLRLIFFGCQDENYLDHGVYLEMAKSRWTA
jgi:hypothetical protein